MNHSRPLLAVTVGGTAHGKTRNERVCGYITPQLSGVYRISGTSGYTEGEVWREADGYRARLGDPHDMDSRRVMLSGAHETRLDAASAVARRVLLAAGERPTYFKYGTTE